MGLLDRTLALQNSLQILDLLFFFFFLGNKWSNGTSAMAVNVTSLQTIFEDGIHRCVVAFGRSLELGEL